MTKAIKNRKKRKQGIFAEQDLFLCLQTTSKLFLMDIMAGGAIHASKRAI